MRQLNGRFLLILLAVLLTAGGSVFLIHRAQSGRIARALLRQAERAEQQERPDQKVKFLGRYLEFQPQDNAVRAELGKTLARPEVAVTPRARERALFVLEQVLLREPDRHDSRQLLVRMAMPLGRHELAREHLNILEASQPEDGTVHALLGQWHEARGELVPAAARYRQAIAASPQEIDAYVRLARLLRHQTDSARHAEHAREADQVMNDLVARNADEFEACLARWQYRREFQPLKTKEQRDEAAQDVDRALALAPREARVLQAAAELALLRDDPDEARAHLRNAIELHPQMAALYQALARLEVQYRKRHEAVACLRQGIRSVSGGAGQGDLLWMLANLLIDDGDLAEAEATINRMRRSRTTSAAVDYLSARTLVKRGQLAEAARALERTRPLLAQAPELQRQVDLLLGQCYERLDEPGRRLEVFRRMVDRDPRSASARQGLAATLWSAGRVEDALEQYRQLVTFADAPSDTWTQLARLLLLRNLQRPQPAWKEVEEALDRAAQAQPTASEPLLLRAEFLLAQRQPDAARQLLDEARRRQPTHVEWYTALAGLEERQGQLDPARQWLLQAKEQCGDSVSLRLAWARHWTASRDEQAKTRVAELSQRLDAFSEDEQAHLLRGLAEVCSRLGDFRQAEELWSRFAARPRFAGDLRVQLLWFDLAMQAGDEGTLERVLAAIRRIEEGEGPLWHHGEALRLIRRAQKDNNRALLDEARTHLDAAAARRPNWPAVLLARARVEELKGNLEQAIASYRRAIELGENGAEATRALVQLLHRRQRFAEAEQEISKLEKRAGLSPELQRLAADISLHVGKDPIETSRHALQAVASNSNDYRDFLWLGQVLAARDPASREAEVKLRRAVELGGQAPETWVALVRFLAASDRVQEADKVLEQAKVQLPESQRALALAQCLEALNRPGEAQKHYGKALSNQPGDVMVLRSAASFHLRNGQLREAEPILRTLMEPGGRSASSDTAWARRNLALALANFSDYRRFPEALALVGLRLESDGKLIELRKPADGEFVEDQRVRARVLVTTNRRPLRRHAIGFLEELARRQGLSADDQFLLAQLYEADGAWPRAREQLRGLTTGTGVYPLTLAHAARSHLRQREPDDALRCIERLEQIEKARKVDPGQLGSIELRAQYLEAAGKGLEAVALLQQQAARPGAPPETALQLADCLARQNRLTEALDVCERAWDSCPPEAVGGASVAALRTGKATAELTARVERMLEKAIQKHSANPLLLLHLADVRDLQERYDDAVDLYRQVLKRDEANVVALNNLAWLLAMKPGSGPEALRLINRAIELVGPRAELLDTRAMVHLSSGRGDLAIADLEQTSGESPTGSRYFHLARAHLLASNATAAAAAFRKAKSTGLDLGQLHPVERVAYRKMLDELK